MTNDFLLEIGCEELPSKAIPLLAESLAENLSQNLQKAQLTYQTIESFATPRRIAIRITALAIKQPDQLICRRGPSINAAYDEQGQPSKALLGFVKSCQINLEQLSRHKTDKGEWLVYENETQGANTVDLLPKLIETAIKALPIAKPMRWGVGETEFVRPVHWLVALLGDTILPLTLMGIKSNNFSYGHRFLANQPFTITHPQQYEDLLREVYVIANCQERRRLIVEQIKQVAASKQGVALMPDELVDEVCAIVEWPVTLIASFEPKFLQVPKEVLIASMQSHQRCFPLQNHQHQLLPFFIIVSNLKSLKPGQVISGNEKVMAARLSDAEFFYHQDQKMALSESIERTRQVIFQSKLGSLFDKTQRIEALMVYLTPHFNLNVAEARRAAQLSKCDLVTGMVGEFPELQGLMGYYYALHDQEPLAVAQALVEQYLPRFAADNLPLTSIGAALSLADRLDTLVGVFAIGQKPSGDKDPFKLRRHALAIIRILINQQISLNLSDLIRQTLGIYQIKDIATEVITLELHQFIFERLYSFYQMQGITLEQIQAVKACQQDNLADFDQRLKAVASYVTLPTAQMLAAAGKRVDNILSKEKLVTVLDGNIKTNFLEEKAEQLLFQQLLIIEQQVNELVHQEDYVGALNQLALLGKPIDAFFDQVMVMSDNEDWRHNRLNLLKRLQNLMKKIVDISRLHLETAVNA